MSQPQSWRRVSRRNRCQICGKPDWCSYSADGAVVICARVKSGKPVGSKGAGWLHKLREGQPPLQVPVRKPESRKPKIDWAGRSKKYTSQMNAKGCTYLAEEIGISSTTLKALEVGWCCSRSCWTWPMRDANGDVVGIRTRYDNGEKRSDTGSDGNGLFLGPHLSSRYLLIVEGPTDCATLVDCGFESVIGRPNCRGGTDYILAILRLLQPQAVLLLPDRDDAGLEGFSDLAAEIVSRRAIPLIRIDAIVPPEKDVRAWAKKSREDLSKTIATKLKSIKARSKGPRHDEIRL